MMEARLAKIQKRKLKEKGIEVEESGSGIADFDFETKDKTEGESKEADMTPDIKTGKCVCIVIISWYAVCLHYALTF